MWPIKVLLARDNRERNSSEFALEINLIANPFMTSLS